jgi:hypothetical protein
MDAKTVGKPLNSRIPLAAALVSVGALAIVLLIATTGGRGQARAQAFDPAIPATLGVFAGERDSRDDLPGDPVAVLRRAGDAQKGEDPSLSRRVDVAGSTRPAFLWPMADGVCYSAPEGGSGCAPIARIRDEGVEVAVSSAIRRSDLEYLYARVFGIARDGIDAVTLGFADGRELRADVRDNVFFAALTDMPNEVRWQDSRGNHVEPITGGFGSREQLRAP